MTLFIKSILFSLVVPGTVAVIIPLSISPKIREDAWLFLPGGLFLLIGFVIYCWCVWDFIIYGQGTPAPINAPKHLVIKGLYQYTRNPMYLGVLMIIFGWTLFFSSLFLMAYGLCIAIFFQLLIVFYEEPSLQRQFSVSYGQYKNLVNRWIPNI